MLTVLVIVAGVSLSHAVLTANNAAAGSWNIEIVESGYWFQYPSLALNGSGYPRIAYYNGTSGHLDFAVWNGSSWSIEIADTSANVGQYTSIALENSTGRPHISYLNVTDHSLRHAWWNGTSWNAETVTSSGNGIYSSIALNESGYPQISYYSETIPTRDLKCARWDGTAWNIQTVDSVGNVGAYTSISLDRRGYAHISYYDLTNANLKHAWWDGGAWLNETVDSVGVVGGYTSIALDSRGYPHIGYQEMMAGHLKYAGWDGAVWKITTIDPAPGVGEYASLALDGNDFPHMSYYDSTNKTVRYAWWNGTTWSIMTVDSVPLGDYTSIAMDKSSNLHIVYDDQANGFLKHATWLNAPPDTPTTPSGPASGVVGTPYGYSTSATDPDGDFVKYTFDWGDGNKSETGYVSSGVPDSSSHVWSRAGMYNVTAMATDFYGDRSGWSGPLVVTIAGVPTAPLGLTAVPGNAQTGLSWNTPSNDGGSAITNYTMYRGTSPGGETFLKELGNVLAHTDTGLLNGQTYCYQVAAKNSVGEGPRSTEVCATPATFPEPPTGLTATAGDAQVTLAWSAPANDGGSPVINYTIHRGIAPGAETPLVTVGNILGHVDTGLTNGQVYYYKLSAINAVGGGPQSNEASATPHPGITAPSEPLGLQAVGGNAQVLLSWSAPASDGGSPVTNYKVYRGVTSGGETYITTVGDVLAHTDSGLTNGQTYYYQVSAVNGIGEGPGSTEASATPATVPGAPTSLSAGAGNAQITLIWSTPSDDGGSPILNYTVFRGTTSGGEAFLVKLGNVLTYLDTSLTNGLTYYYTVAASNALGQGQDSVEASATPATFPTEPLSLQAFPGNAEAVLTWSAPATDGGSPITNYWVHRGTSSGSETRLLELGNVLMYTDTGLLNGQPYFYKVSAKNVVGEGPQSAEASVTPSSSITAPSPPRSVLATAGSAQVTVIWTAPVSDGGSPVTNYVVHRGTASGGETRLVEIGNVLTYIDVGLVNGQVYYYQVTAKNIAGEGAPSNEASATPATVPGAPTSLSAVAGNGPAALDWTAPADDGGYPITNYEVYRGTTSGGETLLIELASVLTYTDTSVVNGQKYYYRVSAKNSIGEGAQSNEANATPFAPPNQLPTCTIATPSAGDTISGTYTVSGSSSDLDGTVQYVEVRIDAGIWIRAVGNSSWSFALDTTALADGAHTIYARSFDGADHSGIVNVTVNVNNAAPPHPGEPSVLEQAWFWIAVVVAAFMAVLLLIFLLRRRRKMQNARDETPEASAEKTGESQNK